VNERILLVEDDEGLRETIADLLREEGYDVAMFASGYDALEHLRTAPLPRVILLDLMLAGMDGFEFRRLQLAEERIAHVPVVLLSGTSDLSALSTVLHAAAFLRKPFDVQALLTVVADTCRSA
jgi:CheY-like chemotaxis protein